MSPPSYPPNEYKQNSSGIIFICKICRSHYIDKKALRKHIRENHENLMNLNNNANNLPIPPDSSEEKPSVEDSRGMNEAQSIMMVSASSHTCNNNEKDWQNTSEEEKTAKCFGLFSRSYQNLFQSK